MEKILSIPEETFLAIGPVIDFEFKRSPGIFDISKCVIYGEAGFINKFSRINNQFVCASCIEMALRQIS